MPAIAVVIAHYDPAGRLAEYLLRFVAHVASLARQVVFVSTGLGAQGAARLGRHARVMVRDNYGYDFWSYRLGIEALGDLRGFDALWILNSSFIIFDPPLLCDRLLRWPGRADLLGLTHSAEWGPHLQSYCIAFRTRAVLDSPAFATWWGTMTPLSERLQVVRQYELGMSRHFVDAGFATEAVFVPSPEERLTAVLRAIETRNLAVPAATGSGPVRLMLRDAELLNPVHFLWDGLFDRCRILKLELARTNPRNLDLRALRTRLEATPSYLELYDDAIAFP